LPPFLAKHLPPSAARPRVLALDPAASALLSQERAEASVTSAAQVRFSLAALPFARAAFDAAVASQLPPGLALSRLNSVLRPGGRLLALVAAGGRAGLLAALGREGFIHLYAEPAPAGRALVRGERPPLAAHPVDRIASVAAAGEPGLRLIDPRTASSAELGRYLHLLVAQTPNKPAWRLAPGEPVAWQAAVGAGAEARNAAPAFTSLVKAVAFMQAAVRADSLRGVNKVGKFPAPAARAWPFALVLDPSFADWRGGPWAARWEWQAVDPGAALRGEE
jgi:SAM-dependent methyltransferase